MVLVKIHKSCRMVVAVCDKELLGKCFTEGIKQLDLTGKFFAGEEKTGRELEELLLWAKGEDATFNFVGKESCKIAVELGLIHKSGVLDICGIPTALRLL